MQTKWTKAEDRQLRKLYPRHVTSEVACALDRSEGSVKKRAGRLGITKTKKYLRSLGRRV